jgi:hypothetical protein
MAPRLAFGAAVTDVWKFLWQHWTAVPWRGGPSPGKSGIGPNEMQSPAGEIESNSPMPNPHRASAASAREQNRKTAPSPPLPLPLSPGKRPSFATAEMISPRNRAGEVAEM